jgi:hypothetical protein
MTDFFLLTGRTFVHTVAEFIVPDWGIKLTPAKGYRTGPHGYIGLQAGTTTLYAGVNFIPPVRDHEFGY